jgi:hypothetical protein
MDVAGLPSSLRERDAGHQMGDHVGSGIVIMVVRQGPYAAKTVTAACSETLVAVKASHSSARGTATRATAIS